MVSLEVDENEVKTRPHFDHYDVWAICAFVVCAIARFMDPNSY